MFFFESFRIFLLPNPEDLYPCFLGSDQAAACTEVVLYTESNLINAQNRNSRVIGIQALLDLRTIQFAQVCKTFQMCAAFRIIRVFMQLRQS